MANHPTRAIDEAHQAGRFAVEMRMGRPSDAVHHGIGRTVVPACCRVSWWCRMRQVRKKTYPGPSRR
jgi:hypothetical protein